MKRVSRIKSALSVFLTLALVFTSMIGVVAGNYDDTKYGNVLTDGENLGYEAVFLTELPSFKNLDFTNRGFLNVTYYQTSNFNHVDAEDKYAAPPIGSEFWGNPIGGEFVKDVDGSETYATVALAEAAYTAVGSTGRIYIEENKIADPSIGNTSPYGKKTVIRGYIVPTEDVDSIQLGTYSDDGTIITFDGEVKNSNWNYQAPDIVYTDIAGPFEAGSIHTIHIEYFENRKTEIAFKITTGTTKQNYKEIPGNWFFPYREVDNSTWVAIDTPIDNSRTNAMSIDIAGTTEKGNKLVRVYVRDNEADDPAFVPAIGDVNFIDVVPDKEGNWSIDDFDIDEFQIGNFIIKAFGVDPYGNISKPDKHTVKLGNEYAFEFLVKPGDEAEGSISTPVGIVTAFEGGNVPVTATPAPGYRFVKWWGKFYTEMEIGMKPARIMSRYISQTEEFMPYYQESFELKPITDMANAVPNGVLGVDGSIVATDGDVQDMLPVEYKFVTQIYAEFELIPTPTPPPTPVNYSLTVNVVGEGSVPGFEGTNNFSSGTNVNLGAILDNPLYTFVGWSGDLVSTNLNDVVVMTGNKTVTATFALVEEEPIPEEEPVEEIVQEVTVEDEVVLDVISEEVPEALELPDTSGVPVEAFAFFGTALFGIGAVLKRKTK